LARNYQEQINQFRTESIFPGKIMGAPEAPLLNQQMVKTLYLELGMGYQHDSNSVMFY